VARFFDELESIGALPTEPKFRVVTHSGRTRVWGRNPKTGEEYYGPELKFSRFPQLQQAIDAVVGEGIFDLSAEGKGPTTIRPFDLYNADNYAARRPEILWKEPYSFSVHCKRREKITHFLHSPFGCKCEIKPDEPAIFENPWNHKLIQTSALASARFWIQISIDDWLIPMIIDTLEILDTRFLATANSVFGVEFTQGCICNDD